MREPRASTYTFWVMDGISRLSVEVQQLRVFEESQIESGKYQDNADIHHQPFPEVILKDKKIHTQDNDN